MRALQRGRGSTSVLILTSWMIVGAVPGCGGSLTKDIEVHVVADPAVQTADRRSYAWMGAAGVVHDPAGLWAPRDFDVGAELRYLVDRGLRERGYQESGTPEFLVAMLVVQDVQQLEEIKTNRAQNMLDFVVVGEGALLLELIDPKTQQTVWAGAAAGHTRSDYTSEQSKKRLAHAVQQLLRQLPAAK